MQSSSAFLYAGDVQIRPFGHLLSFGWESFFYTCMITATAMYEYIYRHLKSDFNRFVPNPLCVVCCLRASHAEASASAHVWWSASTDVQLSLGVLPGGACGRLRKSVFNRRIFWRKPNA